MFSHPHKLQRDLPKENKGMSHKSEESKILRYIVLNIKKTVPEYCYPLKRQCQMILHDFFRIRQYNMKALIPKEKKIIYPVS